MLECCQGWICVGCDFWYMHKIYKISLHVDEYWRLIHPVTFQQSSSIISLMETRPRLHGRLSLLRGPLYPRGGTPPPLGSWAGYCIARFISGRLPAASTILFFNGRPGYNGVCFAALIRHDNPLTIEAAMDMKSPRTWAWIKLWSSLIWMQPMEIYASIRCVIYALLRLWIHECLKNA